MIALSGIVPFFIPSSDWHPSCGGLNPKSLKSRLNFLGNVETFMKISTQLSKVDFTAECKPGFSTRLPAIMFSLRLTHSHKTVKEICISFASL